MTRKKEKIYRRTLQDPRLKYKTIKTLCMTLMQAAPLRALMAAQMISSISREIRCGTEDPDKGSHKDPQDLVRRTSKSLVGPRSRPTSVQVPSHHSSRKSQKKKLKSV